MTQAEALEKLRKAWRRGGGVPVPWDDDKALAVWNALVRKHKAVYVGYGENAVIVPGDTP